MHPKELSAFIQDLRRRLTNSSTVRIEHAIRGSAQDVVIQSATIGPESIRALEKALQADLSADLIDTFIPAPTVARMLGVRAATLAKWRRQGRGPAGAVRTSPTTVSYPASAVIEFQRSWTKGSASRATEN